MTAKNGHGPKPRVARIIGQTPDGGVRVLEVDGRVTVRGDAYDLGLNGVGEPQDETTDDSVATAADLIRCNAVVRWAWEGWLPIGVLTILAAETGRGKTRFCADLARRIYLGLPWPDGKPATLPAGSKTLWVAADNQHPELGSLPGAFGFPPESLFINAPRSNPFIGTMLDSLDDLVNFEKRIVKSKPSLVFVDTVLNATERSAYKPEDAKAFFVPLMQIAQRTQTSLVCVTHLNSGGKPLGRRIMGQGRVVMQLDMPDPSQENRRKLYVVKSNSLYPPPLGVTMGDHGNEYDTSPPESADAGPCGDKKTSNRLQEAMDWLKNQLKAGSKRVSRLRDQAEASGFSTKTLYAARYALDLEEFEMEGKKYWQLTSNADEESA